MPGKKSLLLVVGLVALLTMAGHSAQGQKLGKKKLAAGPDKGAEADREAIRKTTRDFVEAFEKGDAKAVASLWTEQGECHEADGDVMQGRAAIEKAFAEFFQLNPKSKMEVVIESIRFPAADLAIEEGILRQISAGKELPTTTLYSVTHVRQGGQWKIAVSREWGAGRDRLEDLDWLIGTWKAAVGDQEVMLSFSRDKKKPFLHGEITQKKSGKVASSGTMKIGIDPQRDQLRSWHFAEDGGHGQALWVRDRNNWVLDSQGVQGDGTETASVNILGRLSNDELTWRSIDRVMGDQELPDTVPIKLTRVNSK